MRDQRWLVLAVVAALVAVTAGALWLVRSNSSQPVDEAILAGTARYVGVLDAASAVKSLDDIGVLAAGAAAALPDVQRQQQAAERAEGELAGDGADVLKADAETLTQLVALAPVAKDAYRWGSVQPQLDAAATATKDAVKALGAVDADAAASQPDTSGAITALSGVLDDSAVAAAASDTSAVLTTGSTVQRTAQVSALGDRAASLQRRIGVVLPALT